MLQCELIAASAPIIAAIQRALCDLLHKYTGAPDADVCAQRHSFKFAALVVQGGPFQHT
jgi:hypothetical protein